VRVHSRIGRILLVECEDVDGALSTYAKAGLRPAPEDVRIAAERLLRAGRVPLAMQLLRASADPGLCNEFGECFWREPSTVTFQSHAIELFGLAGNTARLEEIGPLLLREGNGRGFLAYCALSRQGPDEVVLAYAERALVTQENVREALDQYHRLGVTPPREPTVAAANALLARGDYESASRAYGMVNAEPSREVVIAALPRLRRYDAISALTRIGAVDRLLELGHEFEGTGAPSFALRAYAAAGAQPDVDRVVQLLVASEDAELVAVVLEQLGLDTHLDQLGEDAVRTGRLDHGRHLLAAAERIRIGVAKESPA